MFILVTYGFYCSAGNFQTDDIYLPFGIRFSRHRQTRARRTVCCVYVSVNISFFFHLDVYLIDRLWFIFPLHVSVFHALCFFAVSRARVLDRSWSR